MSTNEPMSSEEFYSKIKHDEERRFYNMLSTGFSLKDDDVNKQGGKQAYIDGRPELIPPTAVKIISKILKAGAAKYSRDNWRKISEEDHLSHALLHIYNYLEGKESLEDDLGNATCRLLFALDLAAGGTTRF